MTPLRWVGIVLIVAGALALGFGGFSYTRETHQAKIGPLELSMKEKERVNFPQWAGLGAIAFGVVLVIVGGRKRK